MALHVETAGRGPDLVLLHGWGLHGAAFTPLVAQLAARFRIHVVDLPGHGHSRGHALAGLDAAVDAIAGAMPATALLAGWSFGGLLALRLAVRHPARVRGLALVSATPCFVRRPGWPHAMAPEVLAAFADGLARDATATLRRFLHLNVQGGPDARSRARELAALLAARGQPAPAALEAGLALLRDCDLREEARNVAVPATVIHGARDALVPIGAGRWLGATLPRARLVEIDAAGHLPFVSHAAQVAQALEALHG